VAGFIGSPAMNFFDARIVSEGDRLFADTGVFRVELTPETRAKLVGREAQEVILGIRPEDIYDRSLAPSTGNNANVATVNVEVVEHMGSELYVYFVAGKSQFVARLDPRSHATTGQPMEVLFDASRVHLFDRATQACISN
jgi:multiple sugar transport system ATP-binding protein